MIRKFITGAIALSTLAVATPSSAATYTYNMNNGSVMTIDTTAMIGTLIGSNINATFSGAGLATFAGGFNLPSFMTNISISPTSTRTVSGTTYYANTNHQQMLETGAAAGGTNVVNLWSYWGTAACPSCNYLGDYVVTAVSSSTGGTPVPEPGMVGLMGLGFASIVFARRRRSKLTYKSGAFAA